MTQLEIYGELKTWQQGIAALIGFVALITAALWNFRLNRKRDAAFRREEAHAVAAALYGEMRLLRVRAADAAKAIASVHIRTSVDGRSAVKFDKHFADANKLPEPTLYTALASKFGCCRPG
jgi:hypothetical protein